LLSSPYPLTHLTDIIRVVENNYSVFLQENNRTSLTNANTFANAQTSEEIRSQDEDGGKEEMDKEDGSGSPANQLTASNLQAASPSAPLPVPSVPLSRSDDSTLEMIVHKRRDHLNTWVLRYLTCDGEYLHYFHDIDEVFPKKSVLIDEGLKIQLDILPVMIEGQKRFTWTLTHAQRKIKYVLACTSMEDCLLWSTLIQKIQRKSQDPQESMKGTRGGREEGESEAQHEEEKDILPFKIAKKQISDQIQYFKLDQDSEDTQGGSTQNLSLTRLVVSSLPLYYLSLLWRYCLSLSLSLSLSSLSVVISLLTFVVVPAISKLSFSSFS
jgi:hypothetical protein